VGLGFGGLRKIVEGADIFVGRYLLLTTVGYVGLKFLKFKGVLTIESIGALFSGAGSVVRWVFCSRFLYLSLVSLALLIAPECKYTYIFICFYKYYFSHARVRELSCSLFVVSLSASLFPSLALSLSAHAFLFSFPCACILVLSLSPFFLLLSVARVFSVVREKDRICECRCV